ncbi:hypothetical protein C0995_000355, partial [Termitomyces sp. Mi166
GSATTLLLLLPLLPLPPLQILSQGCTRQLAKSLPSLLPRPLPSLLPRTIGKKCQQHLSARISASLTLKREILAPW